MAEVIPPKLGAGEWDVHAPVRCTERLGHVDPLLPALVTVTDPAA